MRGAPVKVLVIDDSAHNRRALSQILESAADVEVVARAGDGEEGLRRAVELRPDVITLDLEMPRLDGYAFLRLLMARAPTPVIVISGWAHRKDVFKALELGAFDFLAKPRRAGRDELESLSTELLEKVRAARSARVTSRPALTALAEPPPEPALVIGLGASTGGPPAIQRIVEALADEPAACVLVAQHMPPRFTAAFAERLDRRGTVTVKEASDAEPLLPGHVYIGPGNRQLLLQRTARGLALQVTAPAVGEKHAPSVDRLFASMAETLGARCLGVVLTGMGADGALGVQAIARAGGEVWAESEESAIVFGMPKEAIDTGQVRRILPISELGPALLAAIRAPRHRGNGSDR